MFLFKDLQLFHITSSIKNVSHRTTQDLFDEYDQRMPFTPPFLTFQIDFLSSLPSFFLSVLPSLPPSLPNYFLPSLLVATYWCVLCHFNTWYSFYWPQLFVDYYLTFRKTSRYHVFYKAFLGSPPHHYMSIIFSCVSL